MNQIVRSIRRRGVRKPRGMQMPLALFQFTVARIIQDLSGEAYCDEIREVFEGIYDIKMDAAQVYVTLKKLNQLGYVTQAPMRNPNGRGRKVEMYRLTKEGTASILTTDSVLQKFVGEKRIVATFLRGT